MPDEMYDQVKQLADLNTRPERKGNGLVTLIVVIIFLAGLGIAGYAGYDWWKGRPVVQVSNPSPTPSLAPTSAPTISPAPSTSPVNVSLKIQILNGTGVPGVAGKVKDLLTAGGYTDVTTGNAQAYQYDTTVIMAKPEFQSSVLPIQTILSKNYQLDNQKNNLDATSPFDLVIIVGKN